MYHGPLRTTTPPSRINDDLILNAHLFDIKLKYQHLFLEKSYKHQIIDGDSNDYDTRFDASFLKKTFVYVITETVSEYPYPYFSEKTWKAMLNKVPFMMVGSQHSLQQLQSFGFRTFSNWWDETYDSLPIAADRIEAMVIELKKLSELSHASLLDIRLEMQSTVDHNFNQIKCFKDKDLDNINNKI